jgi:maltose O-acetyltransferase
VDECSTLLGAAISNKVRFETIMRILCLLLYYGFAQHIPTPPTGSVKWIYRFRQFLVSHLFLSCGTDVMVKQHAYFGHGGTLRLGDRAQIGMNARIDHEVTIGDDCVMGPDVVMMTMSHEFEDPSIPINQQPTPARRPIKIGRDVWIGTRVVILPGVEIGEGSVIGVGSIVNKSIPPYSVAVGVPARVVRKRGDRLVSASPTSSRV